MRRFSEVLRVQEDATLTFKDLTLLIIQISVRFRDFPERLM